METTPLAVISVIRDLLEADTVFFRLAVALPEPMRGRVIGNRTRMTHDVLMLMRTILEPTEPQRFVVNIPLGGTEWQVPVGNFDDVPVIPTAVQLAAAFEHNVETIETDCAVCQESVAVGTRLRNCSHVFHQACITQWLGTSSRCPVCRDDVRVPRAMGPSPPTPSAGGSRSTRG